MLAEWQLLFLSSFPYDYMVPGALWGPEGGELSNYSCPIFAEQNAFKKQEKLIWEKWMSKWGKDWNRLWDNLSSGTGQDGHRWGISDNLGPRARRPRNKGKLVGLSILVINAHIQHLHQAKHWGHRLGISVFPEQAISPKYQNHNPQFICMSVGPQSRCPTSMVRRGPWGSASPGSGECPLFFKF